MKEKSFGLDIGTTFVRAVLLKKDGNSYAIESLGIGPAPEKGMLGSSDADLKFATDAISQVIKSANISTKNVVISLPENHVYTKIIEMPELSEKELAAALRYEMEQYIPLPLDQVRTDWQVLNSKQKDKKTTSVLIVAAPINLLSRYEKVLTAIGLVPISIETEMISVQRAIYPLVNNAAPSVIVHMGANTTNIAIMKNGVIAMVINVDKGGHAITRAIANDLGIDIAQAEEYKKVYGLNKEAFEGKIGKSLFPIVESIAGDIKNAILLYKEKNQNEPVQQIVLSGGTALLPGIDVYFTNLLNVQVVLGNPFQVFDIKNIPDEVSSQSVSFNVVVGLALKNVL